jgi:hypothetical protein
MHRVFLMYFKAYIVKYTIMCLVNLVRDLERKGDLHSMLCVVMYPSYV